MEQNIKSTYLHPPIIYKTALYCWAMFVVWAFVLSVHESMRNGSSDLLKKFHLTGHRSTHDFSRIYLAICSDSVTKKLENT